MIIAIVITLILIVLALLGRTAKEKLVVSKEVQPSKQTPAVQDLKS